MKRLNGMDAMLLYSETPNLHTHTLKVAVIDPGTAPFGFEAFRRHLSGRMHLLEPLRYQLVEMPWRLGHPMWRENCEADLDYHLRRVQIPAPGGRRELDQVIGEIASTPLDRGRPLWEFHFAEGLAGGRCAVIGKVHHCLADGIASANLLARLMNLVDVAATDCETDCTATTFGLVRAALADQFRQLAALPGLIRDAARGVAGVRRRSRERGGHPDLAAAFDAPPTFLNSHVVSPQRRFASAALPLAEVKATAAELGVTINDLILSMAAGGLRTLLLDYDGVADRPIVASVPTATDKSDRITGNEISGLSVSLPVHIDDPVERVRLVALATRIAKEDHEILGPGLYGRMMSYLPAAIAPAMFRWLGRRDAPNKIMNVAVSSVLGPRRRGNFAGAPVSEIYSTGVLSPAAPVNITVWSYADQLGIAVLTDDKTFTDTHDATAALTAAFDELRSAATPYATLTA
ncbi:MULTISPECIES: WS/DGAT/MGAT family O-acyltransferase [Mycobacterium]|uniref:Diacylglycerol O-acyltransferase n=1 Tax=Mycobacterium kiyosense TaxID=2871094 RepID=A0A9P3Q962_9MYCO|nr:MULTISPECIES: wax ester/triacylglycerol synthase family O-acyltransferase [Mycobacterium]BDB45129.1 diacylglycerol O-acyltransferase [Mycobacterium kiyosense]BDE16607.1 diacylglycerol O-acyltransferase [Mycobacterium sp. 20KCMC460]GLB84723.1 diacylglycerol O-acyltransferase [Mycobacterium kiyosense]GLB89878.1 diacylglycerol O-acyltransferase [Mycobacterium kiyosense]GLB95848.1 diacylglycerol O-acyltransferase [Mycobacterium kiyosense]